MKTKTKDQLPTNPWGGGVPSDKYEHTNRNRLGLKPDTAQGKAQHSPLQNKIDLFKKSHGIPAEQRFQELALILQTERDHYHNHADKLAEVLRDIAADAQEANERRNTGEWDFRCTHIEAAAKQAIAAWEKAKA